MKLDNHLTPAAPPTVAFSRDTDTHIPGRIVALPGDIMQVATRFKDGTSMIVQTLLSGTAENPMDGRAIVTNFMRSGFHDFTMRTDRMGRASKLNIFKGGRTTRSAVKAGFVLAALNLCLVPDLLKAPAKRRNNQILLARKILS